jgi:peptidoglycan hydrolase CwlO-like protein
MKKSPKTLIILMVILGLIMLVFMFLFVSEKKTNYELIEGFELEKQDLENEYSSFAKQYDELQLTISNDSLAELLEREQTKTQRLLEELRTVKSSNALEIRRLKKELSTLRKVMISYINQIDSLNKVTQEQRIVIDEVTKKYNTASRQISTLAKEKKKLNQQVSLAAQLDASNLWMKAKNRRDRDAKKLKDATKFHIGFTLAKNITAEAGERTLFISITKPDQSILTKDASLTFDYENKKLPYSIKKYIEYDGEEQNVTVYWDIEEFLYAGTYRIDIFANGLLIGSKNFNFDK